MTLDPRHRDVVRRDRGRGRRGRPPRAVVGRVEPGRPARPLRRRGARGREPRPRRADHPGDRGGVGRVRRRARRHRRGGRVPRSRSRRRAARGGERGEGDRARRRPARTWASTTSKRTCTPRGSSEPDLEPPLAVLHRVGRPHHDRRDGGHGRYRVVGQTVDDAAGEAFDKVARHLGLGYPGGPAIDRSRATATRPRCAFPRAMPGEADFSFAGLKTAVVNHVPQAPRRRRSPTWPRRSRRRSSTSWSSSCWPRPTTPARPSLAIGGGVAANSRLRARVAAAAEATGRRAFLPPPELCTDNGAMIAATAWWRLRADGPTPLDAGADPNLRLG